MFIRRQFLERIGQTSEISQGFVATKALGCTIYDQEDQAYLDLISGFCVSNIGHSHPKVIEAIAAQSKKFLHTNVYGEHVQNIQVQLAENICSLLPSTFNSVYFLNSGSEAVDAAIKLARKVTQRSEIICCRNAYHGSTIGAESLRSDSIDRAAFRPLIPDITHINANQLEDLEKISHRTAAIITEVVQAEAGVKPLKFEFLKALKEKCDQYNCLLIFDEIQTGFGRTGNLFAFQKYNIAPDILLLGKALGSGLPLSALVGPQHLIHQFSNNPSLGYISTFGGNPLCCSVALAGLKVLLEENLTEKCNFASNQFVQKLKHPKIKEIRAEGLLIAIDFLDSELVWGLIQTLYKNKILVESFLFDHGSLRISPPLIINQEEIDKACNSILYLLG